MKTKKLFIIGERSKDIPKNWLIFNAPRPLLGDEEWQGDFQHGIFYAAIDPNGYIPKSWVKSNCSLDGWLIEYISEKEAIQKAKDYYYEQYPNMIDNIDIMRKEDLLSGFHLIFNTKEEVEINL